MRSGHTPVHRFDRRAKPGEGPGTSVPGGLGMSALACEDWTSADCAEELLEGETDMMVFSQQRIVECTESTVRHTRY